jgi:hypothetical protein
MVAMRSVVLVLRDIAAVVSIAAVAAGFALTLLGLPDEFRQMAREIRHGRYGFRRSLHTWQLILRRIDAEDEAERRWQTRSSRNFRLWLWCLGVMFVAALVSVGLTKLAAKV